MYDHVLAFILIVAFPTYAYVEYRRLVASRARKRAAGEPTDNVPEYRGTIAIQWALAGAMIVSWLMHARSMMGLGFGLPPDNALWNGWGFAVIGAFTIAFIAYTLWQASAVRKSEALRDSLREQMKSTREMLPTTRRELRWFYALSVTAGVCEEALYRGWMLWYLSHAMNIWVAAILSAVIFGVAHAYQGAAGVAKVSVVGVITAAMYVISGSLWLPMILHAAIDVVSGRMAFDLHMHDSAKSPTSGLPIDRTPAAHGYDHRDASARTSPA